MQVQPNHVKDENQLFQYLNYSIRKLTEKDREVATRLLVKEFGDQQPLSNAFCRLYPHEKQNIHKVWQDFYGPFMQDAVANQTSIVVVDLNTNEIVAASTSKCVNFDCPEFQQKIMRSFNFGNAIIKVEEGLFKNVKQEYQPLMKLKGKLLDIWGVGIKKEHMGKRLLHQMMKGNQILGKKQGYEYGFSYVVNFKTGVALTKLNYEKIADLDAKEFEFEGKKVFCEIEEKNRYPSLWLKKLE